MVLGVAIQPASIAAGEHNDCAVRALAVAIGVTYEQAHHRLQVAGRKNRGRTKLAVSDKVYREAGLTQYHCQGITVARFLLLNQRFTGILHVRGHLIGVCDGNVFDWVPSDSRRIVKDYWR